MIYDFSRINRRMHNKVFIVDNTALIIGGRNVADDYFDNNTHLNFTDTDVVFIGDVAKSATKSFMKYWEYERSIPATLLPSKRSMKNYIKEIKAPEGYALAQDISAYSLIAVARYGQKILNHPGSIVTLTYMGSVRAIPNYNAMGIVKAALESAVRYLARDMGKDNIRVNAISAGAMKTLAVTGVADHSALLAESERRTVDQHSVTLEEIGGVCAFLMSDLATGVVGDVIYADKGVHLI